MNIFLLALLILCISLTSPLAQTTSLSELLRLGKMEYTKQNYRAAIAYFDQILSQKPNSPSVVAMKRRAALQIKNGVVNKTKIQIPLSKIIIPELDFKDTPMEDALEFIRQQAEEQGGTAPNFVIAPQLRGKKEVTIKLTNVPLMEVIRYVAELSNAEVRYEKHAIRIFPRGQAK